MSAQALLFGDSPSSHTGPTIPPTRTVSRYRLALVREHGEEYDAEPLALSQPEVLAEWLQRRVFAEEPRECMVVVYLDVRCRLIGWTVAYQGGLTRGMVEPRGILAPALLANAAGIVLAHNHPSGDPSPSAEDIAFTRRVADGGELLGIKLHDHVIIGDPGRWVSLRRRGGW